MNDTDKLPTQHAIRWFLFLCLFVVCSAHSAEATKPTLATLLRANRYSLTVLGGGMAGPGAAFLKQEISEAQFVAIGEEHGTRQVPQFVWAACRAMAPDGLDAMAIEAGPLVTAQLERWTAHGDGSSSLLAFETQYPDSIAFFNWKQDFDLLSQCQQVAAPHALHLWGLDQEFLGSPGFILQQILETRPRAPAESIARKLQIQCELDTRKAIASGSWTDGCMLRLSQPDLENLRAALKATGNRRALELAEALIKTWHIYTAHEGGHRYDANRERALLLKHNFVEEYQHLYAKIGKPPRVLLKFGGNHLFKGFDETDVNDLGNFITEFADGLGSSSLHIEILGMRGDDESHFGPGQPDQAVAKDTAPGPLAPIYAEAYRREWTVFDLRPLRATFASFGHVDRDLERLIFGYDTLVLIPQVTAQAPIQ